MTKQELYHLTEKFILGTISPEEKQRLDDWYAQDKGGEDETEVVINYPSSSPYKSEDDLKTGMFQQIKSELIIKDRAAKVRHIDWKRIVVAASILLVLATGAYTWLITREGKPATAALSTYNSDEILPGKEGAILTLADGTKVVLDSLGNGTITTQGASRVVLNNGQLQYDVTGEASKEIAYNVMTTPKGRQFNVILPDGTHVWMNAESSLEFPTSFSGGERKVKLTGEAYFEIAKNAQMPFRLIINDKEEVEVLGTRFNVKAYKNEELMHTTLLEGAVRVRSGNEQEYLKPGQQALIKKQTEGITIAKADTDKVMAWKNGLFNFEDANLEEVMRQLSRWYNIDVVYEKGIPDIRFGGEIKRSASLNDVLTALESTRVHFRIEEGRKLVVLP